VYPVAGVSRDGFLAGEQNLIAQELGRLFEATIPGQPEKGWRKLRDDQKDDAEKNNELEMAGAGLE
jgi:hypothetical protein